MLVEITNRDIPGETNYPGYAEARLSYNEFLKLKSLAYFLDDNYPNRVLDFSDRSFLDSLVAIFSNMNLNEMNIIQAILYNLTTGKSFVKNSWSDESKGRLQTYFFQGKLVTQDRKEFSSTSTQLRLGPVFYSPYKGKYETIEKQQVQKMARLKELEEKIQPLYNQFKEYENLKRELAYLE